MIVYVHIPFCHRICPYCSFYKHTPGDTDIRSFIQALLTEAKNTAKNTAQKGLPEQDISTLYLGGGTPSMLSPSHLTELFEGLHEALPLENTHITLEANPATFGDSKAALFKSLGVNRTSLGIQSFSPHVLKTLGREHNPEQAAEAVRTLRRAGMDEINIDLMFAIPGQSEADWQHTLETAIGLTPDHISAYNLTYEEDTEFINKLSSAEYGDYNDDEDTNANMFTMADKLLTKAGFHHYETSNYAQAGKESKHNLGYWHGTDYLGLGPSAVSTIGGRRWKNLPDTAGYITTIQSVGHAKREEEIIDSAAYRIERIALLLRTTEGLPMKYTTDSPDGAVDEILTNNLGEIKNNRLTLINDGTMLVDALAEKLV
ncbi:radical SAM family heme chaperone HemW [Akkermansiaceae bacterium]|nr:radical SAM family heme chaperone HemW [Akkermansiaceae bacterium]